MKHKRGLAERDALQMHEMSALADAGDKERQDLDEMEAQLNDVPVEDPWEIKFFDQGDLSELAAASWQQYSVLAINIVSPPCIMVVCLWILKSAWAAALSFHLVTCLLLPCFYILYFSRQEHLWSLLDRFRKRLRFQLGFGVVYFVVVSGLGFLGYWGFGRILIPNKHEKVVELGFSGEAAELQMTGVYFCAVNPLLEEFFWRVFLKEALGNTECRIWIISCCYAFYHIFVMIALDLDPFIITFCAISLCFVGRAFAFACTKTGALSAALAHSGGDLVIMGILWDWFLGWG